MNINPRTTPPRTTRNHRSKPGTCHMMSDGRILTTAELRRLLLKRYWSDASKEKTSG